MFNKIPFAVDTYKTMLGVTGNHEKAKQMTKEVGYVFGDGSLTNILLPGNADRSKNYDNALIDFTIDDYAYNIYEPTEKAGDVWNIFKKDWRSAGLRYQTQEEFFGSAKILQNKPPQPTLLRKNKTN